MSILTRRMFRYDFLRRFRAASSYVRHNISSYKDGVKNRVISAVNPLHTRHPTFIIIIIRIFTLVHSRYSCYSIRNLEYKYECKGQG